MHVFAETLGMIGSILLIIAYFLLQSKVRGNSYSYLYLNLCGASLILFSLFYDPNRPAMVIEIFWICISIYGIWKRKRKVNNI